MENLFLFEFLSPQGTLREPYNMTQTLCLSVYFFLCP